MLSLGRHLLDDRPVRFALEGWFFFGQRKKLVAGEPLGNSHGSGALGLPVMLVDGTPKRVYRRSRRIMKHAIADVMGTDPELATKAWLRHGPWITSLWEDPGILFASDGRIGFVVVTAAPPSLLFALEKEQLDFRWETGLIKDCLAIGANNRLFRFGFQYPGRGRQPEFAEFAASSLELVSSLFENEQPLQGVATGLKMLSAVGQQRMGNARIRAWKSYLAVAKQ